MNIKARHDDDKFFDLARYFLLSPPSLSTPGSNEYVLEEINVEVKKARWSLTSQFLMLSSRLRTKCERIVL